MNSSCMLANKSDTDLCWLIRAMHQSVLHNVCASLMCMVICGQWWVGGGQWCPVCLFIRQCRVTCESVYTVFILMAKDACHVTSMQYDYLQVLLLLLYWIIKEMDSYKKVNM